MIATEAPLASWNDSPARRAIEDFVTSVADERSESYLTPKQRVAVFDNDGTLWCERPLPVQADFLLRRLGVMADQEPSLRGKQPWKAVVEHDYKWLTQAIINHYQGDDSDLRVMADGLLNAYSGTSIDTFASVAESFLQREWHPTLGRPYKACVFAPMLELLTYLEANSFTNYIVTGGGRDFLRPVSSELYGIPADRVIGSSVVLEYRDEGEHGDIVHSARTDIFDDGPAKPVQIWNRVGRRPVLAAGNANGDVQMLRFTGGPSDVGLRLLIEHDDAEREFSYTEGTDEAVQRAKDEGWTELSMKRDWKRIFAGEPLPTNGQPRKQALASAVRALL
jgi:hypothetical protein